MHELLQKYLHKHWGHHSLKPFQEAAIKALLNGQDTLVLAPTGGGKSLCYQLPALAANGLCIVVSPLIALMQDQVDQLKAKQIPAAGIHSGMGKAEIKLNLEAAVAGTLKLLYIAPERIGSRLFVAYLKEMQVSFIAVDEAHCISQWGHDFRPSYRQIARLRDLKQEAPLMALTASATEAVRKDIQESLRFQKAETISTPIERDNLSYRVAFAPSPLRLLLHVLKAFPGSSIVYVGKRADTRETAAALQKQGFKALNFHAGLKPQEKKNALAYWQGQPDAVMVATSAFGMGIDKPDVRTVVHLFPPTSLEDYYQQAGRAGRDGKASVCCLILGEHQLEGQQELIEQRFVEKDLFFRVYKALCNHFQIPVNGGKGQSVPLRIVPFAKNFNLSPKEVFHCLETFQRSGLLTYQEARPHPPKLHFPVDANELYDFQLKHIGLSALLKYLLRVYGGNLYTRYVDLDLTALSKATHMSEEELHEKLSYLRQEEVAQYVPGNQAPRVIMLTERLGEEALGQQYLAIDQLKANALQKWEGFHDYIRSKECRQKTIGNYFGHEGMECGNCDNCLMRYDKLELKDLKNNSTELEERYYVAMTKGLTDPEKLKQLLGD